MALYVDPERDQFEAFKALPRDAAVMMLNLVKYRERARYDDGRDISGAEAYAAYGRESAPVFERVGGKIIWRGKPQVMLIGPFDQQWDLIFVRATPPQRRFSTWSPIRFTGKRSSTARLRWRTVASFEL